MLLIRYARLRVMALYASTEERFMLERDVGASRERALRRYCYAI